MGRLAEDVSSALRRSVQTSECTLLTNSLSVFTWAFMIVRQDCLFFFKVLVVKRAGAGNSCFLTHKRKMCEENITQFFCRKITCRLKASGCVSSSARADVHLWLHYDAASKHLHINVQRHTSFTSMYKLETGDWTTAFSKLIKELNKGNLIRGLLHSLISVWNNENYITNRITLTCYQITKILCIAKVQLKAFCLCFFIYLL